MARPRKRLALLALLAAALLSLTMLGGPASAATTVTPAKTGPVVLKILISTTDLGISPVHGSADIPQAGNGCNYRICMHISTPINNLVLVYAWVRIAGDHFDGHYQLINPRGNFWNSGPNRQWYHNEDANFGGEKHSIVGKWCVIGWRYNGGHNYSKIGEPCITVKPGI